MWIKKTKTKKKTVKSFFNFWRLGAKQKCQVLIFLSVLKRNVFKHLDLTDSQTAQSVNVKSYITVWFLQTDPTESATSLSSSLQYLTSNCEKWEQNMHYSRMWRHFEVVTC